MALSQSVSVRENQLVLRQFWISFSGNFLGSNYRSDVVNPKSKLSCVYWIVVKLDERFNIALVSCALRDYEFVSPESCTRFGENKAEWFWVFIGATFVVNNSDVTGPSSCGDNVSSC